MDDQQQRGAVNRVLEALAEPTRAAVEKLLAEPLLGTAVLAHRVKDYAGELAKHTGRIEIVDHWTGNLIAWKCLALLEKLDGADEESQRLIQTAVLYFVEQSDAEDDLTSAVGFDDDLEVVDVIARELGFVEIVEWQGG